MGATASQITSLTIVYLTIDSGTQQKNHQRSTLLALSTGSVNSPHKRASNAENGPFDDVIMNYENFITINDQDNFRTTGLWKHLTC